MNFEKNQDRLFMEAKDGSLLAEITFVEDGAAMCIDHTFVSEQMRGRGLADELVTAAVKEIQSRGKKVTATCSYAQKWLQKHTTQDGRILEFHRYHDVAQRGCIERLNYVTKTKDGRTLQKYANVYLPYGYDQNEKYNILYVIHGGGGNPDAWLDCCQIKNMLDQSFAEKRAKACIVVFPTYYTADSAKQRVDGVPVNWENTQIFDFQQELRKDLIPAVESKYNSWLSGNLQAGRNHRAITGFSMGGGTTWYAFLENMDLFAIFLPLSGDCWIIESRGGETRTEETVDAMIRQLKEKGFGKEDFRVFAATGSRDIAYPALTPMIEEMRRHTDLFEYSTDLAEGNLHYGVTPDAPHTYEDVYQHIYNYLPYIWK